MDLFALANCCISKSYAENTIWEKSECPFFSFWQLFFLISQSFLIIVETYENQNAYQLQGEQKMTTAIDILDKALLLPDRERAQIAEQLISSLDRVIEPSLEVELAWQQEIERRLSQIDSGEVKCVPWEEVRDNLRRKYCVSPMQFHNPDY
ncbi:MAG: addiction module protein [Victivallales bacterium]|jgi:putative addiction module component (TIGR02574 family)